MPFSQLAFSCRCGFDSIALLWFDVVAQNSNKWECALKTRGMVRTKGAEAKYVQFGWFFPDFQLLF